MDNGGPLLTTLSADGVRFAYVRIDQGRPLVVVGGALYDHRRWLPVAHRPALAGERAGLTLSDAKRAFLIQGDDRVGAVTNTAAKLAEANINITAAAATSAGSGRYGMILWVAPDEYERAAEVLGA